MRGMFLNNATATITNVTIDSNEAGDNSGAGITVYSGAKLTMNGGTISGNSATANGGVHIMTCTYTYKAGTVCGNTPSNSYETHTSCPN